MDKVINAFNNEEIMLKKGNDLNSGYLPGNSTTSIPVDMKFDQDLHSIYQEPLPESLPGKSTDKTGFFESFGGRFEEQNEFLQAKEFATRRINDNSPLDDYVDPNWLASDDKTALIGVDPRNTGYILDATGPKDQRRRYNYVLDHQEYNEKVSNGNMFMQLLGGFTGFGTSPSTMLTMGTTALYSKLSQTFIQNLPKLAAGVAVSSASHEAVLETAKIGGNLHDWAVNTAVDTIFATALMGVHLGFKFNIQEGKLYNARGLLKMTNNGIDARPVLNDKGVVVGYKATAMDGSVGAAQVDHAQVYLDAAMSKSNFYNLPYVGDKVGKALGKTGEFLTSWVSPKIRMFNSQFSTVRGLVANHVEHAFDTVGMEQGRPNETPFQTMMEIIRGTNTNLKVQYDGLFLNRNGIEFDPKKPFDRTKANIKGMAGDYFKNGAVTREEFGREVQYGLITEEHSKHAAVNEAMVLLREQMDPLYLEHLKLHGISDKILKPRTAKGFLSRVYYTARMELNEDDWIREVSEKLSKDDAVINSLKEPINLANERIKSAQSSHDELIRSNPTNEQIKLSSDNLEDLKRAKQARENELQNTLRENEDLNRHVDDVNAVSANEAAQIKSILKPLDKLEKDVAAQKEIVSKVKSELSRNQQASQKAKTKDTAEKRAKLKDMGENDVRIEEEKLHLIQEQFDLESERLQEQMHNKEIPEELYYQIKDSNRYQLKDHTNRLKTRETYESDFHRQQAAKAYYDTILNQTAEDNINSIMNKMMNREKENPLTQRTLLIDDKWLYDNNWLHPDPAINVMNYRNFIGRKNSIKKVLNRLTVNGDFDELIKRFVGEHSAMKSKLFEPLKALQEEIKKLEAIEVKTDNDLANLSILKKQAAKTKEKYDKQVKRLGRSYRKNKEDLELSIADMTGKNKYSQKAREYSRMANLWAVAVKLGFLPFTMSTDLMANVFKHGFWPTVKDGLFPMLKNLGGMLNTEGGALIRENAAHAHIADRHVNMAYTDKNWTGTSQTYEPVQGKLTTGLETLAHYSNNFSLANYVENANQRFTAFVINSKIMKAMTDFLEGNIKSQDLKDLLRYGIDPKVYAERFVKGANDTNGFGGNIGKYWEWADKEASNIMSQAIRRAVNDTIIRRGPLDAPFAMNNPLINSLLLFKGYTLASLTRFLAPLMQKPDARKIIGTMLMMTAGATQNPLRRLASGKDPMEEEDHMLRNSIRDGGVFSVLGDTYEDMNYLTHGFVQESVTNERYRNRTEMGVFNGPIGGMANDMTRVIGMVASQEWNQTDLKRLAVNMPFLYSWELRNQTNKWIQATGLPKTRTSAHKMAR